MTRFANGLIGTLSLDADGITDVYIVNSPYTVGSIQLVWTGTPTGSLYLQKSIDLTNWVTMGMFDSVNTNQSSIDFSGSADDDIVFINDLTFPFMRLKYVMTSGDGDLNFYIVLKKASSSQKDNPAIFMKPEGMLLGG